MKWLSVTGCLLLAKLSCFGFSLLGPYANWMQQTNGYRWTDFYYGWPDIGGPMEIGQGYRWNVPVVTYAFDKSFLDFFGSNGVAAVEQAIAILNDLPPASNISLSNVPLNGFRGNFVAQDMFLMDLKSTTLTLLIEHLGLTEPIRNIFDLRRWDPLLKTYPTESEWPPGTIPNLIIERNFDPESLAPSHEVNGHLFTAQAGPFLVGCFDVFEVRVDPFGDPPATLADHQLQFGQFWWGGLSRDDLGGLRYLLSTNTVNVETLLPDVRGTGTNTGNFVQVALRPGVEKITFVRQQYDSLSGQAVPITNQYVDTYITNNIAKHQLLERVITTPDFLFSAGDVGDGVQSFARTGTTNWWSSAIVKGSTNQESGLIVPPVNISFDRLGAVAGTGDNYPSYVDTINWATFDDSTNPPIVYPTGSKFEGADLLSIHLVLSENNGGVHNHLDWKLPVPFGGTARLQMSTNLFDWVPVGTTTNVTGSLLWDHRRTQQKRFFRVVPQ